MKNWSYYKTLGAMAVLAIAFIIVGTVPTNASDYSDAVAADNPIAWWRLDDANDSAGTHHGTAGTGVTFGLTGVIRGDASHSAVFDQTSAGAITVPDATDLNFNPTEDLSIECWFKRDDMNSMTTLINKGDTNGSFWVILNNDGKLRFNLDYGTTNAEAKTEDAYDDGKWHHVVAAVDRDQDMKIYVDGSLAATKVLFGERDISSEGMAFQIGSLNGGAFWQGNLDELAIYDHAVTSTQISDRYQAGIGAGGSYTSLVSADNPIAWWRMDNASDSAGSHSSMAGNGVSFDQIGAISGDSSLAAAFDGTTEATILVGDAPDLNFGEDRDFTIEGWFSRESGLPGMTICNKGDTNGSFWVRMEDNGELRFLLDYGDLSTVIRTTGLSYDDGQYHYFTAVADRDTALQLYVDGSLIVETDPYGLYDDIASVGHDLIIGSLEGGGLPYSGILDEVALYNVALTEAQVSAHYEAADLGLAPGDADRDGDVDADDAAILAENWLMVSGATWEMGDFNGDGKVNDIDATLMAVNWTDSTASVPEPTTLVLLLGIACALAVVFRGRK